jgi:hypothetical protein
MREEGRVPAGEMGEAQRLVECPAGFEDETPQHTDGRA